MLQREEILQFLAQHKQRLHRDLRIVKLGLFGSFAQGNATEASDIDLIVEFEPNTDDLYEKKIYLKEFLKTRFAREVDVCREKYIKPVFKAQILRAAIYV